MSYIVAGAVLDGYWHSLDVSHCMGVYEVKWLEEIFPNEPSWRVEDTGRLAASLAEHGVDHIDISSSGNHSSQKIKTGPAYQARFSEAVKRAHGNKILVINAGTFAQPALDKGLANVVFVKRMLQKDPGFVSSFADGLGGRYPSRGHITQGFRGFRSPLRQRCESACRSRTW
ncbi:hypothetical protein BD414DRAFT_467737 [Trametes punicea]|nr:hypothetical protein BD414DRAFT_467737 [Trametes punicea]